VLINPRAFNKFLESNTALLISWNWFCISIHQSLILFITHCAVVDKNWDRSQTKSSICTGNPLTCKYLDIIVVVVNLNCYDVFCDGSASREQLWHNIRVFRRLTVTEYVYALMVSQTQCVTILLQSPLFMLSQIKFIATVFWKLIMLSPLAWRPAVLYESRICHSLATHFVTPC
jgi:hypothetical protein